MDIDAFLDADLPRLAEDIKRITLTPSPTFREERRLALLERLAAELGFRGETDAAGNLLVALAGADAGADAGAQAVVYSAHVDTVFPMETPLVMEERGGRLHCPGVCDNSTGTAALLGLLRYIAARPERPRRETVFLFNVGEEELGNLRGVRAFYEGFDAARLRAHIVVEGHELGRVTTRAVGSHRLRVTVAGPGGHSWRDHGRPNAIAAAASLITRLCGLDFPSEPKTTFNVGTIRGGETVNSIPSRAEFSIEVRGVDEAVMRRCVEEVRALLRTANGGASGADGAPGGCAVEVEAIGDRPCGALRDTALAATVLRVLGRVGVRPILDPGSTDANWPISLGLPALTIGISGGGGTHSSGEHLELGPLRKGMEQLLRLFEELDGESRAEDQEANS